MDIVRAILDAQSKHVKQLADHRDKAGRVMLDIAVPKCRRAVEEMLLFHKRYRLGERKHASSTSVVYFATDCEGAACAADERPVALKFMRDRDHFEREIQARGALRGPDAAKFVLDYTHVHDDDDFAKSVDRWQRDNELEFARIQLGRYCIVMPRAQG